MLAIAMAVEPAVILPHGVPGRRIGVALGLSLLAHFLLVGGWGAPGTGSPTTMVIPLQARLEPAPAALPPPAVADIPLVSDAPRPAVSSRRTSPAGTAAAAVEQSPAGTAASGPDLRFYLARELDQYPSPLSALRLDDGSVRLWVSIDQTGRVVDAAVIDADPPGEIEMLARERVLATRFVPAQRDGRTVKSRVLLVLGRGA